MEVCELVNRVFNQFIAPLYGEEGVEEFRKTSTPEMLQTNYDQDGHTVHVALIDQRIIGVLKTKETRHISWFFVEDGHQNKGVGKKLIRKAIDYSLSLSAETREMTVNSSPNSYETYKKIGFHPTASETEVNGIRYTPMTLRIEDLEE